ARPGRAGVQLAGLALGECDQVHQRVDGHGSRHHQQARAVRNRGHGGKPLQRLRGHASKSDAHRIAHRDEQQRVAVRGGLGSGADADDAPARTAVVGDHGLADAVGELRRNDAPYHVVAAAGRKRNHEAHRLGRVGLRPGQSGGQAGYQETCDEFQRGWHGGSGYILALMRYETNFRSIRDQVSAEEWQVRVDLAACYRLVDYYGMTDLTYNHITARVPGPQHHILINLYGLTYKEVTASSLAKIDLDGEVIWKPDTDYYVNRAGYVIHGAVHRARKDVTCVLHTHTRAGMAVAA